MRGRIVIILLTILNCIGYRSFAQSWRADFSSDKFNATNGWYYTDDFVVNDNILMLNGREDRTRTIVEKFIDLPRSVRYRGVVSIGQNNTSSKNNFYVLLAMTNDRTDKSRRFVALSFGEVISMVELSHTFVMYPETRKFEHMFSVDKKKYVPIYDRYPYPSELLDNKLCFDVTYDERNGWDVKLYSGDFVESRYIAGVKTSNYRYNFAKENFVGFAVNYTKSRRKDFYCYSLSVSALDDSQDSDNDEKPNTQPDNSDEVEGKYKIVLSEIMANPEKGAPEYVEIYNQMDKIIDLSGYYLVYTSGKKNVSLPLNTVGSIKPHEYLVLSSQANSMSRFYENVIDNSCKELQLPILSNTNFEIGLRYGESGTTYDNVRYSSDYFPKGYKTKKGISLQRIDINKISTIDNWEASTEDARKSTPTRCYIKGSGNTYVNDDEISTEDDTYVISKNALYNAYSLMKASKNVDIQLNVYNIFGDNLLRYDGEKAKQFLTYMLLSPRKVFNSLFHYRQDCLIMSILFRESKEGTKRFVYKFKVYKD